MNEESDHPTTSDIRHLDCSFSFSPSMLPVLLLVVPPSVAGGGYACWFLGQQTALSLKNVNDSNNNNNSNINSNSNKPLQPLVKSSSGAGSYTAAIVTLAGVYGALSTQFPNDPDKGKDLAAKAKDKNTTAGSHFIPPHKQAQSAQFQPPKSFAEAFQRVGRPMIVRAGAGGVALFCAGIVQTLVTNMKQS
eukprot:scaffold437_cov288-Chaetoceros_neogracile.AAC.49